MGTGGWNSGFEDLDDLIDPITLKRPASDPEGAAVVNPWQRWPGDPTPDARPPRPEWAAGVRAKTESQSAEEWLEAPTAAHPSQRYQRPEASYLPPPAVTSVPLDLGAVTPPAPQRPPRISSGPRPAGRGPARPPIPGRGETPLSEPDPRRTEEASDTSEDGTYQGAAIAALVWCAVPVVFYIGWALVLAGKAEAGCVDDNGQPCPSPQVVAWKDLVYAAPTLGAAALLSILVALALRRFTTGWRSTTVGFASAVVGSGVVTVVWSALVRS